MKIVKTDENNNRIFGHQPDLIKSDIVFNGKNNILICEEDVTLHNSELKFNGDNSIIYLSTPRSNCSLVVTMYNNSVFFIDENAVMNGKLRVIVSEGQNVLIGKECLFSWGIRIRVSDVHLIYDVADKSRVNLSKSVFLGDHIWIGQDAMILKGTHIGSGSIIGAKSLAANKKIPSNAVWGGNPAKEIRRGVFFTNASSNLFTKERTEKYMKSNNEDWIYSDEGEILDFDEIDRKLSEISNVDDKVALIKSIRNNTNHNRFYIG